MTNTLTITVYDDHEIELITFPNDIIYYWDGYEEAAPLRYSLLHYAETHGDRLKDKYLAWLHDLAGQRINGKPLVQYYMIEKHFSYWWLFSFVNQANKNSLTSDIIRILAIEEILIDRKPTKLRLVSANKRLQKTLARMCKRLKIPFYCDRVDGKTKFVFSVSRPILFLKALLGFGKYIFNHWSSRKLYSREWINDKGLFVCTYSDHLDAEKLKKNEFYSYYWCELPVMLRQWNMPIKWIHMFAPSLDIKSVQLGVKRFRMINDNINQDNHIFVDSFLTVRIVFLTLCHWLKLVLSDFYVKMIGSRTSSSYTENGIWYFLQSEWNESIFGTTALLNLLRFYLFDCAFSKLSHQAKGLYLCENQAWERCLIHAWRKYDHGVLSGIAHSTTRFWDMRYFIDHRIVSSNDSWGMPLPDHLVLNNKLGYEYFAKINYPTHLLKRAEALRYNYLRYIDAIKTSNSPLKMLVLGDYNAKETHKLLALLSTTFQQLDLPEWSIVFKPHPNCKIDVSQYTSLNLVETSSPLQSILQKFNVVVTSNGTSASVEAYELGVLTIVLLNDTELNFSPLRGRIDVIFVYSGNSLFKLLQALDFCQSSKNAKDFFYKDERLSRWQKLLKD